MKRTVMGLFLFGVSVSMFVFAGFFNPVIFGEDGAIEPPDLAYYDYDPFRFGDVNSDGWCNFGDVIAVIQHYMGNRVEGDEVCWPASDVNGNGISGEVSDVVYLIGWMCNPDAPELITECDDPVIPAPPGGQIWVSDCLGAPGATVPVEVHLEGTDLIALNFSLAYNNQNIESVSLSSWDPAFNDWNLSCPTKYRENMPPGNNDTLTTVTFLFVGDASTLDNRVSFPSLATAFTLEVVISPNANNIGRFPLIPEADEFHGPQRFYMDDAQHLIFSEPLFESGSSSDCSYVPGDCDEDGTARQLTDAVMMIAYYRDQAQPGYVCYCTDLIPEYKPSADADGNCIPFELTDVVWAIAAYRGPVPLTGCEHCP